MEQKLEDEVDMKVLNLSKFKHLKREEMHNTTRRLEEKQETFDKIRKDDQQVKDYNSNSHQEYMKKNFYQVQRVYRSIQEKIMKKKHTDNDYLKFINEKKLDLNHRIKKYINLKKYLYLIAPPPYVIKI